MVQYVITPWRSRHELLNVRNQLYPSADSGAEPTEIETQETQRRKAIDRISVWMQRGNCPHLVEATAMITAAVLNDISGNSGYCVRAAYAAAFGRFVTGLLDSHQDKRHKLSMFSIAKNIGLPATYVELRHQAIHEELPSLFRLRGAAREALQWIWSHYWAGLTEPAHDSDACLTFLRDLVANGYDSPQHNTSIRLPVRWSETQIRSAFEQIQDEVNDPRKLLLIVKLSQRLLKMCETSQSQRTWIAATDEMRDVDKIREEMSIMRQVLAEPGLLREEAHGNAVYEPPIGQSKSWAMWDGAWVPKPIGCI